MLRRCIKLGRISGTAADKVRRYSLSGDGTRCCKHFADGNADFAAEVDDETAVGLVDILQRVGVRFRKVAHVDIITDTGTVARGIIIAENLKFFPHTGSNFHNDG